MRQLFQVNITSHMLPPNKLFKGQIARSHGARYKEVPPYNGEIRVEMGKGKRVRIIKRIIHICAYSGCYLSE